jgi:hypothetical protein
MVRALNALIVMAVSVSGSYLTDALASFWMQTAVAAGIAGLK